MYTVSQNGLVCMLIITTHTWLYTDINQLWFCLESGSMGGNTGSTNWRPPPEPAANTASGPVDYHMVGSQVVFSHTSECGCCPRVQVDMDCEQLYHMLAQQFTRGYRMLYFTRMPGDMHILIWSQTMRVCFSGFFRMNPNLGERYDSPVSWQLCIDRCWFQATIEKTGGFFSLDHRRTVDTANIVACIGKNTHHGERLVAAAVTGHALTQSFGELQGGLGPRTFSVWYIFANIHSVCFCISQSISVILF